MECAGRRKAHLCHCQDVLRQRGAALRETTASVRLSTFGCGPMGLLTTKLLDQGVATKLVGPRGARQRGYDQALGPRLFDQVVMAELQPRGDD